MNSQTWQGLIDDLKRWIAQSFEAKIKACKGVGPDMAEITRAILATRQQFDALKCGDVDGLQRIAERNGFVFDLRWIVGESATVLFD